MSRAWPRPFTCAALFVPCQNNRVKSRLQSQKRHLGLTDLVASLSRADYLETAGGPRGQECIAVYLPSLTWLASTSLTRGIPRAWLSCLSLLSPGSEMGLAFLAVGAGSQDEGMWSRRCHWDRMAHDWANHLPRLRAAAGPHSTFRTMLELLSCRAQTGEPAQNPGCVSPGKAPLHPKPLFPQWILSTP